MYTNEMADSYLHKAEMIELHMLGDLHEDSLTCTFPLQIVLVLSNVISNINLSFICATKTKVKHNVQLTR